MGWLSGLRHIAHAVADVVKVVVEVEADVNPILALQLAADQAAFDYAKDVTHRVAEGVRQATKLLEWETSPMYNAQDSVFGGADTSAVSEYDLIARALIAVGTYTNLVIRQKVCWGDYDGAYADFLLLVRKSPFFTGDDNPSYYMEGYGYLNDAIVPAFYWATQSPRNWNYPAGGEALIASILANFRALASPDNNVPVPETRWAWTDKTKTTYGTQRVDYATQKALRGGDGIEYIRKGANQAFYRHNSYLLNNLDDSAWNQPGIFNSSHIRYAFGSYVFYKGNIWQGVTGDGTRDDYGNYTGTGQITNGTGNNTIPNVATGFTAFQAGSPSGEMVPLFYPDYGGSHPYSWAYWNIPETIRTSSEGYFVRSVTLSSDLGADITDAGTDTRPLIITINYLASIFSVGLLPDTGPGIPVLTMPVQRVFNIGATYFTVQDTDNVCSKHYFDAS